MPQAPTFGIEIEYAGPRGDLTTALRREGIPMAGGDEWSSESRWVNKTDGSVYNGGELASPILRWDRAEDREQVSRVVEIARSVGCAPSEQAGIHVHVGVNGMTPDQVASVSYGFLRHEDFLYRMASSGWDHMRSNSRSYAHPYNRADKAMLVATDFSLDSVREIANSDRYYGVNFLSALGGRRSTGGINESGTIEFRVFNTTMNRDRVQAFIATAVGFILAAQYNRFGRPKLDRFNCYPLGGMAGGWRSDRAVFNAAMRALSAGNRVLTVPERRTIAQFWRTAVPQGDSLFGAGYHLPGWTGESAVRKKGEGDSPLVSTRQPSGGPSF